MIAIVSVLAVEASPSSTVPPVTEYVVEPVLRNPSRDPATPFECLIIIVPPVISKYDPGTLIEKGASVTLVDPIVGTFTVPPDIVNTVVVKPLYGANLPAILSMPPSIVKLPPLDINRLSAAFPMVNTPLLTLSDPETIRLSGIVTVGELL